MAMGADEAFAQTADSIPTIRKRGQRQCVILTVDRRRIVFLIAIVYSFLCQLICLHLYFDFEYVKK